MKGKPTNTNRKKKLAVNTMNNGSRINRGAKPKKTKPGTSKLVRPKSTINRRVHRGIKYAGSLIAAGTIVWGGTGLVRGFHDYHVPEVPARRLSQGHVKTISVKPVHLTYGQAEFTTHEGKWSVTPLATMRMFVEEGGEKSSSLEKLVRAKDIVKNTENAAMRAALSKHPVTIDLKRKAKEAGVDISDKELIDLSRRILTRRAAPEALKRFFMDYEIHLGEMEVGKKTKATYFLTHPRVKGKPIPLEIYLRGKHNPENLKELGRELDKLNKAYAKHAPKFFENYLNILNPHAGIFHSWGKTMKAYGDIGPRPLGVVMEDGKPRIKIIDPEVLGYSPAKVGVGPFLLARYAHVKGEHGFIYKQGTDGSYKLSDKDLNNNNAAENTQTMRHYAKLLKQGVNPDATRGATEEWHNFYDAKFISRIDNLPEGKLRIKANINPEKLGIARH